MPTSNQMGMQYSIEFQTDMVMQTLHINYNQNYVKQIIVVVV